MQVASWQPKKRNIGYSEKPEGIPDAIYTEALAAKRFYNEQWEFWVWDVSRTDNVPLHVAEDACIRGLQKAINRIKFVYGDRVGEWYERFLDMGDIFQKVKHPDYIKRLGY
jgi:hypothetical protein